MISDETDGGRLVGAVSRRAALRALASGAETSASGMPVLAPLASTTVLAVGLADFAAATAVA